MLTELFVKNFAIIDEIRLRFEPGFSVISGETGAGKSLLVGSLGLIIGGKASPTMIRSGENEAVVEAVFDISDNKSVKTRLEESGLKTEDQLVIRRQISTEGRSRIYINGSAATLSQLELIGQDLVDLSGQHDQQVLLKEENHLGLLDAANVGRRHLSADGLVAGAVPLQNQYTQIYLPYQKLKEELDKERRLVSERDQKVDFIRYQLQEIEKADLTDEKEEENLIAERTRAKNADFLFDLTRNAAELLQSEQNSLIEQLDSLSIRLERGISLDPTLEEGLKLLKEGREPLGEAGRYFEDYVRNLSVEPARLEEIESRLYQLHQLKKKHGGSLLEVISRGKELRDELNSLENLDHTIEEKEKELDVIGKSLLKLAKKLSDERESKAEILEKEIKKELSQLSMPKVQFHIHVDSPSSPQISDCGPSGYNQVRFDFSANPGEKPKPLAKIASGGELSRIQLALKNVLGTRPHPITYIFDEIDSGIGGGVAEVVGRKLKEIAKSNQVLCVTHLPQIASFAGHHFVIEKKQIRERTQTDVRNLAELDQREEEIARMLGGVRITEKTRAHAKEMLKGTLGH